MRIKNPPGMVAVGANVFVRPDDIECIAPASAYGNVLSGESIIDATGGRCVRSVIHLKSGRTILTYLSLRSLLNRLGAGAENERGPRREAGSGGVLVQPELPLPDTG